MLVDEDVADDEVAIVVRVVASLVGGGAVDEDAVRKTYRAVSPHNPLFWVRNTLPLSLSRKKPQCKRRRGKFTVVVVSRPQRPRRPQTRQQPRSLRPPQRLGWTVFATSLRVSAVS